MAGVLRPRTPSRRREHPLGRPPPHRGRRGRYDRGDRLRGCLRLRGRTALLRSARVDERALGRRGPAGLRRPLLRGVRPRRGPLRSRRDGNPRPGARRSRRLGGDRVRARERRSRHPLVHARPLAGRHPRADPDGGDRRRVRRVLRDRAREPGGVFAARVDPRSAAAARGDRPRARRDDRVDRSDSPRPQ